MKRSFLIGGIIIVAVGIVFVAWFSFSGNHPLPAGDLMATTTTQDIVTSTNQASNVTSTVLTKTTSTINPPANSQPATSTNPNQVTWIEAKQLVRECKITNLDPGPGSYSHVQFKDNEYKTIVDYHPTTAELEALAQSVSSTCATITVIRSIE